MLPLLPTKIIKNSFSPDALDNIKNIFQRDGIPESYVHQWEGPTFGKTLSTRYKIKIHNHPELYQLVTAGLPSDFAEHAIIPHCIHLQSFLPYEIHGDNGFIETEPDESTFYVVVIPFETVNAKTITFNQMFNKTRFIDYKEVNDPLPPGECIPEETYKKYFSHCWPQERPYLSISTVFEWEIGSVFMFDSQLLHASDNYTAAGVTEKNAIVLMTKIKTENRQKFTQ